MSLSRHVFSPSVLKGAKLIIAKLDRLVRNVAFISNLMRSNGEFEAVDFPLVQQGAYAKSG